MDSCVRLIRWLGPASVVAGVLTMALAVAQRQANVYLVLVIPVIVGTGALAFLGIILVFAGFLLTFLLWPSRLGEEPGNRGTLPASPVVGAPSRRWGGGLVPGPCRVSVGSDPRLLREVALCCLGSILAT